MEAWRPLIRRAIDRLVLVGIDRKDWVWGGGTVLALRHSHRESRDVDIFVNDVQYLSYLSPRINERGVEGLRGYHEQANHLRLEFPEGEVDFLAVAPVFTDLPPELMEVDGVEGIVRTMPDKEILGQKLHYRASGFTGRDLYDFVAVTKDDSSLLMDSGLRRIALSRRDALAASLSSAACEAGYSGVRGVRDNVSFANARDQLLRWLASP